MASCIEEYRRLINTYESSGKLNRALEFIPDDETIMGKSQSLGLTQPELSIPDFLCQGHMKEALNGSKLTKDKGWRGRLTHVPGSFG